MLHYPFRAAAVTGSAKAAVIDGSHRVSYAQLSAAAAAFAAGLARRGAKPGDRVAILLPNGIDAAVALWGTLEAGCVMVPLHNGMRGEALVRTLVDADPQFLVATSQSLPQLGALKSSGSTLQILSPPFEQPKAAPLASTGTDDTSRLAALIYTSGSTGEPKGVMLSHANMLAAISMVNAYLQLDSRDIMHSALPLSSSYGLYQLLLALSIGATLVLDRSFAFPALCLAAVERERATVMAAVPTMLGWMANTPLLEKHDLSSLRILTSAAASLPPDHALKLRQKLPGAQLFVMYGQTECKRISWLHPDQLLQRPHSVGMGMAGQEHRVIGESGNAVGPGELGELQVRGPHVMPGYWRRPELTTLKLCPADDGGMPWMRTGDLFIEDAEGYLYFAGRTDEIMKIGGHKVSPTEIENMLCQIPGVLEAAVVGIADATWGEAAAAYLVKAKDSLLTEEDVRQFCSRKLQGFMVPRVIRFTSELPKSASGKILKRSLGGTG